MPTRFASTSCCVTSCGAIWPLSRQREWASSLASAPVTLRLRRRGTPHKMEEVRSRGAGLALLRVWVEDGSSEVRARLTTLDDVTNRRRRTVHWTGAGTEQIVAAVRSWLEEWERSASKVTVR